MRCPDNKYRDGAMSQHLDRFAAQHDRRYSPAAVRGHDDKIARLPRRRVDDGLIRVIVLDVYRVAVHARGRRGLLRRVEILGSPICHVLRILFLCVSCW
jgi:hypothetical protein